MRDLPQLEHADLGLVEDDRTEDLRPGYENAPGRCWHTAEGNEPTNHQIGDSPMTLLPDDDRRDAAWPGHPVDSATRTCCGGIGGHTATCAHRGGDGPPLPAGADPDVFDWDGEARVVFSYPMSLTGSLADDYDIRAAVVQRQDGTIVTEGIDDPLIFLNADRHATVAEVRQLANAMLDAADLVDRWTDPQAVK